MDDETQPLLCPVITHDEPQRTTSHETFVDFDPENDAENPLEWSNSYKYGICFLLALMAFTVTFTCIGIVPVAEKIVFDLEGRRNKSASVLLVTVWELGEAAGPLFLAVLSEIYGRRIVFNLANIIFVFAVGLSALSPTTGLLIFSRFLTGFATASNVLNPSIIGDMFPSESRGSAMSVVALAPLLGGAIGPAISGAVAETLGWRYILLIGLVLAIICEVLFLALLRETYKVTILQRRAARLRQETKDESLESPWKLESPLVVLRKSISRPLLMMWDSSVLQIMSLYGALAFAYYYVMATTLPSMLADTYHFSPALIGSSFLCFSLGAVAGIAVCTKYLDAIYIRLGKYHEGPTHPEFRLPFMIVGAVFLPPTVVLYGWAPYANWPVAILLFSVGLLGFFLLLLSVPLTSYIVDSFGIYSASATTMIITVRCLGGTLLPLVIPPLTSALGVGPGFLVVAAISLVLIPMPVAIFRYGSRWRQKSIYTKDE